MPEEQAATKECERGKLDLSQIMATVLNPPEVSEVAEQVSKLAEHGSSNKIPPRDWIILPLLSLGTILVMLTITEFTARAVWPQVEEDSCLDQSVLNTRAIKGCNTVLKAAEGPWTSVRYNECGYRTTASCGAKPPGTIRIVMMGSSTAEGMFVTYEESYATRVGKSVADDLKRPVQVENLAYPKLSPLDSYRKVPEAIGLQPDVVVFSVAPTDLFYKIDPAQYAQRDNPKVHFNKPGSPREFNSLQHLYYELRADCRTMLVAQHFVFSNTDTTVRMFLASGDRSDFVRQPMTAAWEDRFDKLDILVQGMAARFRAKGIPFIVMSIPARQDAALLQPKYRQPHVDPFAFGNRIHEMADKAGASFIDVAVPLSNLSRPEDLYYVVNNHISGEGHALIARAVTPVVENALTPRKTTAKD